MTYEIESKILNNIPLTDYEAHEFLKYFCNYIRKDNGIIDPMDTNCKICDETSQKFGRIMLMNFGCDVELLDIKKLLEIPLTHYANIIFMNVNEYEKAYLVDMTYSQFFGENIILDSDEKNNSISVSTAITFGNLQEDEFVKCLRQEGFVELNEEILKKYIDAFLNICGVSNKDIAYQNINKLFYNRNIELVYEKIDTEKMNKNKIR